MKRIYFSLIIILSGCTGVAPGLVPVANFDVDRYLGVWHEVARLDHSFERGLSHVTANYSVREDGGIKVVNKGYSIEDGRWDTANGKAYFVNESNLGHLKVSFFGPFYGSYVVFYIDDVNYQYAYVGSHNKDYLWFLSRERIVNADQKEHFIEMAKAKGYATESIVWVDQSHAEKDLL